MLRTSMEPSHDLIDRVVHQYEENCIKLVELHKCTSREQEIKSEKSSSQSLDAQRNIKVSKQSAVADCPINGEIKLRADFFPDAVWLMILRMWLHFRLWRHGPSCSSIVFARIHLQVTDTLLLIRFFRLIVSCG